MTYPHYLHADHVIHRLWRGEGSPPEVCALLDAARDPRIHPLIRRSHLDFRCLYQGAVPPVLAAAAPYLVSLSPGAAFTREVIELGWGKSWGVFLRSPAILQDLVRHFRRFLRVRNEAGRVLFFRFYDPRVLRLYLPTCTRDELCTFFGPVERFSLESGEEDSMLELSRDREALARRIVYLGG